MKNPAVLFYTSDFLTGTSLMSNEEVGAYIRALCLQHQKGHLSENELKQICKKNKIFLTIFSHFKQDKKGLFYNKRMEDEKNKREKYAESRSKNRANPNKKKITYEKDMKNISKTYEEHMENENEDIYILNNNNKLNNSKNNKLIDLYINNINNNISSIEYEKLLNYIDLFKEDPRIIEYGIEYCKMYKAYNINYLGKILSNWNKSGFKKLEDIKEYEKKYIKTKTEIKNKEIFDYDWLNQ